MVGDGKAIIGALLVKVKMCTYSSSREPLSDLSCRDHLVLSATDTDEHADV